MRIELRNPYLSIKSLNSVKLPDFTMLIGRNGVGKTHLLQAIGNGNIAVSDIPNSEMALYNLDTFRPQDSKPSSWAESLLAEQASEKYLPQGSKTAHALTAKEIFETVVSEFGLTDGSGDRRVFESRLRDGAANSWRFRKLPADEISEAISSYSQRIQAEVFTPLSGTGRHSNDNTSGPLVMLAMRLNRKLPHEISRVDILRAANFEGDIIENNLSNVFTRYKVEQFSWAHTVGEDSQKSMQSLMERYRKENIPPWETLRGVLAKMHEAAGDAELFNFDFSDPEKDRIAFSNHREYSFETQMTNRTTGEIYPATSLSSGEKIIMTLFLAAFNQSIGRRLPKLVLLDEVDVVLHPSMISALIAGLKYQFVEKGTRIIMATHSLTTVAMLEEGEIFRVSRKGSKVDVSPVTKSEAIADLSEGIATIDTGLRIAAYSTKPITVLTEGNNAIHLKKWANLFFPNEVDVFDGLPDQTGASQLKTYGRLLARMTSNSHFLIIWDCDAKGTAKALAGELCETANVSAFVFEQRPNEIAPKGIENLYDEEYLKQFAIRSTEYATDKEISVSFASRKKTEFAQYISDQGTCRHFRHFGGLKSVVSGILEKTKHSRQDPQNTR